MKPVSKLMAILAACALVLSTGGAAAAPAGNAELKMQLADTERAFAATMKKRDMAAFMSFIADEAVFYDGQKPLRGKEEIAQFWKGFFAKPDAPFSWQPDQVDVLDSGTLGHSSGPVHDPSGKLIARFNSIWRLDASGKWRIVFDKGQDVCDCKK